MKHREIDLKKVKTCSIHDKKRKVSVDHLRSAVVAGSSFAGFWKQLPPQLAGGDLHDLVKRILSAYRKGKPVLVMMGAHVIKVGLSPVIIQLIKKGIIQGIAMNGAGSVHDVELAYFGITSEDVSESVRDGRFGMACETTELLNTMVLTGKQEGSGFGEAVGKRICQDRPPHSDISIFGQAYEAGIPVTVHVAMGTDIVHQHPSADGAAIGELSLRDFRIFAELISEIHDGGVVLLFGSSVILPEVFIKALTTARNVKGSITNFTTASFDMIRHYRPQMNVIRRPVQDDGKGFSFTGHHEIMIPLLAAGIFEELQL